MSDSWSTRMRLLPEAVSDTLLEVHETHVYQPLRKGLEKVAALSFFPRAVLPNHVTWMSMACALPFVLLTFYGWHFAAAALTIFHDMLDRLDGAVAGALRKSPDVRVDGARVYRKDHLVHDGEYGAYLDAIGDKAFGVTALVALALQPGVVSTLPYWFLALSALKLPLHAALAVTRTQDYRAKLAGKTNVMLPAVGRANCYTNPKPNPNPNPNPNANPNPNPTQATGSSPRAPRTSAAPSRRSPSPPTARPRLPSSRASSA